MKPGYLRRRKARMQLRVSASQLKNWQGCQRRWGYEYLNGIKPPTGAGAKLGSLVHDELERYLKTGVEPSSKSKAGRLANIAMPYARELRADGAEAEHEFVFEYRGILYSGKIDAHLLRDGALLLVDWKTSSDPDRYALEIGTQGGPLTEDIQSITYGKWGRSHPKFADVSVTRLHWHYIDTRDKRDAIPVEKDLEPKFFDEAFDDLVHPVALEIEEGRKKAALDLPQNFAECGKFNGCPHKAYCWSSGASVTDRLRAVMSQQLRGGHIPNVIAAPEHPPKDKNVTLLDLMEQEAAAASAEPATTPITEPEATFVAAQPAATDTPEETRAPKRRGRPKGSKNKPKDNGAGKTIEQRMSEMKEQLELPMVSGEILVEGETKDGVEVVTVTPQEDLPSETEPLDGCHAPPDNLKPAPATAQAALEHALRMLLDCGVHEGSSALCWAQAAERVCWIR